MAASGINEHHEARRKQRFIDMQSYHKKQLMNYYNSNPEMMMKSDDQPQNSYQAEADHVRKVGSPPGITDQDIQKYQTKTGKQSLVVYSAKLPGRLSSTNYNQQW